MQTSSQDSHNSNHDANTERQNVEALQFSTFEQHIRWVPTIITPVDGDINEMVRNTESMRSNAECLDERQSFLQHLAMAKQIEIYSEKIHKNPYNAIGDILNDVGYSIQYLRSILRVSWAVYRYPILEQSRVRWTVGMRRIPEIASSLDRMVEVGECFPDNITAAQKDRHSLCFRLSLRYPERRLGDGDGIPFTAVLSSHGLYRDDVPTENSESLENTSWYRSIHDTEGTEMRCRLVGFDTQEASETGVGIPQPFWQEGRTFLEQELQNLLGDVPQQHALILVDCFSVDLYGRLLIDLRGIYHRDQLSVGETPQPSLGRFELARRALLSGFAFPTYNFFVSDTLLAAYNQAREQKRGAFGNEEPVYHPSVWRRHRYRMINKQKKVRRRRYVE